MNDVMMMRVCLTDHPVHHAAEDDGWDGAQKQDVRQDLGQEVHRHSVVSTDVLVPEDTPTTASSINQIFKLQSINIVTAQKTPQARFLRINFFLAGIFFLIFYFRKKIHFAFPKNAC